METIEVRFAPVAEFGMHAYFVYSRPIPGGPPGPGEQRYVEGLASIYPFGGRLTGHLGRYAPGHPRYDHELDRTHSYAIVAEGEDLSALWARIENAAQRLTAANIEYRVISNNSNAFINTVLYENDLPQPYWPMGAPVPATIGGSPVPTLTRPSERTT